MDMVPVELARSTQGRLFEKHILNKGVLLHPKTGEKIDVDDKFIDTMIRNFDAGDVADIVQVPLATDKNEHSEDPSRNVGEVVGLRKRGGRVYAVIDVRDPDAAGKMGKTLLGASAFLSTNYTRSSDGTKVGPALLHCAVTNRPYVTGLESYKEVASLTADSDNDTEIAVLTHQEETTVDLTKDELLAELKAKHGIDVEALQVQASAPQPEPVSQGMDVSDLTAALTAALQATPAGAQLAAGSGDSVSLDDVVGSVVELSRQNTVLAAGYESLRSERAAETVDRLIGDGYIIPKQRSFAIKLKLTSEEDFSEFVPAEPIVPVNQQTGLTAPRDEREQVQQQEEVLRLTDAYKEYFDPHVTPNGSRRK